MFEIDCHHIKKPLSLRERGWGEGSAKAGKTGKYGQGEKASLLTIAEVLHCLRRTLIRPLRGHLLPVGEGFTCMARLPWQPGAIHV